VIRWTVTKEQKDMLFPTAGWSAHSTMGGGIATAFVPIHTYPCGVKKETCIIRIDS